MARNLSLKVELPIKPIDAYKLYIDPVAHALVAGQKVSIGETVGATFRVGTREISGTNLLVKRGRQVVQSWRRSAWDAADDDSIVVLRFVATATGCSVEVTHIGIPDAELDAVQRVWTEVYFAGWRRQASGEHAVPGVTPGRRDRTAAKGRAAAAKPAETKRAAAAEPAPAADAEPANKKRGAAAKPAAAKRAAAAGKRMPTADAEPSATKRTATAKPKSVAKSSRAGAADRPTAAGKKAGTGKTAAAAGKATVAAGNTATARTTAAKPGGKRVVAGDAIAGKSTAVRSAARKTPQPVTDNERAVKKRTAAKKQPAATARKTQQPAGTSTAGGRTTRKKATEGPE